MMCSSCTLFQMEAYENPFEKIWSSQNQNMMWLMLIKLNCVKHALE